MQSLIDLITSNLWIILILFGVISGLFGKKKKPDQQSRPTLPTKAGTRQPVNQGRTQRQEQPARNIREVYQQAKRAIQDEAKAIRSQAEPVQHEVKVNLEDEKAALHQQREKHRVEKVEQTESSALMQRTISDANSPVYQPSLHMNNQKLIDGMIMSEILGPPRAKQKRRTGRRI